MLEISVPRITLALVPLFGLAAAGAEKKPAVYPGIINITFQGGLSDQQVDNFSNS